jgi:hypothetical protein
LSEQDCILVPSVIAARPQSIEPKIIRGNLLSISVSDKQLHTMYALLSGYPQFVFTFVDYFSPKLLDVINLKGDFVESVLFIVEKLIFQPHFDSNVF